MSAIKDKMTGQTTEDRVEDVGSKFGGTAEAIGRKNGLNANEVGEAIDNSSITALVKGTLLFHRSTSAIKTMVDTLQGAAILT